MNRKSSSPTAELLHGFPVPFVERIRFLGETDLLATFQALASDPKPTFWVNRLVHGSEAMPEELLPLQPTPLNWPPGAWLIESQHRDALVRSQAAQEGTIYIQNASSQAAVAVLNPQAGEKILDLAAAPGGKTLRMAACTGLEAEFAAVEVMKPRFFRMKEVLRRGGAEAVRLFLSDGRFTGNKTPGRFDAVLLDAPCTSEAVFRANRPDTWEHWSPARVKRSARTQKELLLSAVKAVKPGGRILYSTCSLSPEENEEVVGEILERAEGGVSLEPVELTLSSARKGIGEVGWRILPDGVFSPFYLALLRKAAE